MRMRFGVLAIGSMLAAVALPSGAYAADIDSTAAVESTAPAVDSTASALADDPAAHAIYDAMIAAIRKADSLYYDCAYSMNGIGGFRCAATYRMWLKKPNYARVEALKNGVAAGVLVGDGETFWIYWPGGRPRYGWEQSGARAVAYEKTCFTSYMKHPAPLARHSISHEVGKLGVQIIMQILDMSTFHGYTDSMQAYIDGVQPRGSEKVDGEDCDVIHVSIMKGQREWMFWVSKRDHLPRLQKEWVHVSQTMVAEERWSNIVVNGEIPGDKFAWKPAEGWTEFRMPAIEEGLLKPGAEAPDFDLAATDGSRVRLSDLRGKVVYLYVWRCG